MMDYTLDQLWLAASLEGDLTIRTRRDKRGEYVELTCDTQDHRVLLTAATLQAALRGIIDWRRRRYWRLYRKSALGGRVPVEPLYGNEIVAHKTLARSKRQYPGIDWELCEVQP